MKTIKNLLAKKQFIPFDRIALFASLVIAAISHGVNMFRFPYYENDEGTYMSQAWSLLTHHALAPYTYWYDHAPLGWICIAVWNVITGGFFTFGTSVNSGRMFILILHLFSTFFLFSITKKLTGKLLPAFTASLIFSLSPLELYFGRRVLLDSIMIFWVLCSLWLLFRRRVKLHLVIFSAIAFGIAVLTKENAIFFFPACIYLIWKNAHWYNKKFALASWITVAGLVISLYFLYAFMKSEFFPVGFLGSQTPHVSLLATLSEQFGRGNPLPFWNPQSDFGLSFLEWLKKDPMFIYLSIASTLGIIVLAFFIPSCFFAALLSVCFWIFLLRGKLVIDFYVIPLIPLVAFTTGICLHTLAKLISLKKKFLYHGVFAVFILFLLGWYTTHQIGQYTKDETSNQIAAVNWIKSNLSQNSIIAIDDYAYVDLHDVRFPGDTVFPNTDWVWKIEDDPAIKYGKLQGDWKNIDYIMLSHEVLKQIKVNNFPLTKFALDNSNVMQDWFHNSTSYRNISRYISTNGDWISVYKVRPKATLAVDVPWQFYKSHFIHSYGQVVDPLTGNTTSEGQSYAMLRAVMMDDKKTFDGVWSWTKDHLEFRSQDSLFSWLWTKKGNTYSVGDSNSAADADEDIALSLVFASEKWNKEAYLVPAQKIVADIWKKEVVNVNGTYYLIAGTGSITKDGYLVNPSYLSPATYRIFAKVDPQHNWNRLADDVYTTLSRVSTVMPAPDWILIGKTGEIQDAKTYYNNDAHLYGYNAFRLPWRIALDAVWFNNSQAKAYLTRIAPFFVNQLQHGDNIMCAYDLVKKSCSDSKSPSIATGALADFLVTDAQKAKDVYTNIFSKRFSPDGYWDDGKNYFEQNWAWFATALYTNQFPNIAAHLK